MGGSRKYDHLLDFWATCPHPPHFDVTRIIKYRTYQPPTTVQHNQKYIIPATNQLLAPKKMASNRAAREFLCI